MAVTTTVFSNLLTQLKNDFPQITFHSDTIFHWSATEKTVWYIADSDDTSSLLHETAHGILGHTSYANDIELLHLERDAWSQAAALGKTYGIPIKNTTIESALDSYRDWLHARSLCPSCHQNGIQEDQNHYRCVICRQCWKVNDARREHLRRHVTH